MFNHCKKTLCHGKRDIFGYLLVISRSDRNKQKIQCLPRCFYPRWCCLLKIDSSSSTLLLNILHAYSTDDTVLQTHCFNKQYYNYICLYNRKNRKIEKSKVNSQHSSLGHLCYLQVRMWFSIISVQLWFLINIVWGEQRTFQIMFRHCIHVV